MVLAAQMTGCVMAVFLGLLILVSMLSNMYDFGCRCLLFTAGQYGDDGEFAPAWASLGYCVYVVCMASVIICWGAWLAHKSFKQLRYDAVPSFSEALWDSIACLSVTLIALVGAFFVTFGYEEWCRNITKRFSTCSDATHNQIDTKDNINTENFYLQIGIAQFGCWCLWSCLVGICVCSVLKLCKCHQDENIRSSMSRQRQRILRGGGGGHSRLVEQLD